MAACSRSPYYATNKVYKRQAKSFATRLKEIPTIMANDTVKPPPYFVGTTNFTMRKPNFVIIHHTAQEMAEQTLKTFTLPSTEVSAHYLIAKNGTVYHLLNDYLRAHHAGLGRWGNVTDMNSCSIGIEIDNNGSEPFTDAQIASLLVLLRQLKQAYNIPTANFIGHGDFAPTRKTDPSILFPWKTLAQSGFGLWYDDSPADAPADFNHILALRVIGYDVRDTIAAIRAFKRHYMQDTALQMTAKDLGALYNLLNKN
ncbi:MAG: N-acetylmuramoyl-L-alanine amidase [Bacteroidetes bacterium]|nr:N-acetylmuramoyl-L-alanine amidase [Bacteroidota bacterium]